MNSSAGGPNGEVKLAVVIPTLNEAHDLPALLSRVLSDGADLVVVSDGGSEDTTMQLARDAGAIAIAAERGRGQQLQAGADVALDQGADLLWFVHADNVPQPGALQALRLAAQESVSNPTLTQAWGCRQRVAAEGRFYRLVERKADRRVAAGLVYGDSGLCVTASAYRRVGGYRGIPIFEDLDISKRLAAEGPIALVRGAEILVNPRRWQGEGALRTTVRNWMLTRAWNLGVPPERLVRFYPANRADSKPVEIK